MELEDYEGFEDDEDIVDSGFSEADDDEDVVGSGFVVHRLADDQRLQWDPLSGGLDAFHVAGVTHRWEALQSADFAPGRELLLVPEPSNPHDPKAVGIWNSARTLQIGYYPEDASPDLRDRILAGEKFRLISLFQYRQNDNYGKRIGLRVLAIADDVRMSWPGEPSTKDAEYDLVRWQPDAPSKTRAHISAGAAPTGDTPLTLGLQGAGWTLIAIALFVFAILLFILAC